MSCTFSLMMCNFPCICFLDYQGTAWFQIATRKTRNLGPGVSYYPGNSFLFLSLLSGRIYPSICRPYPYPLICFDRDFTSVSAQRRQYKIVTSGGNESAAMTPERAMKLREIGFEVGCIVFILSSQGCCDRWVHTFTKSDQ